MSGLIACRAADASTDSVTPDAADAGEAVNAPATRDTTRPSVVADRTFITNSPSPIHRQLSTRVAGDSRRVNTLNGSCSQPRGGQPLERETFLEPGQQALVRRDGVRLAVVVRQ